MLTFSTGTKIKGPKRQQIGNALEISKPLKKVNSDHGTVGKLPGVHPNHTANPAVCRLRTRKQKIARSKTQFYKYVAKTV